MIHKLLLLLKSFSGADVNTVHPHRPKGPQGGQFAPKPQTLQEPVKQNFRETLRQNLLTFGFRPLINLNKAVGAHNEVDYGKAGQMPVVRKVYDIDESRPDEVAEFNKRRASERFASAINNDLGWDTVPNYVAASNNKAFYEFIPGLKTVGQFLEAEFPSRPAANNLAQAIQYSNQVSSIFRDFMLGLSPEAKLSAEKVATIDELSHNHDRHYNNIGLTFNAGKVEKFHAIDNEDGLHKERDPKDFNTYFIRRPVSDPIHADLVNLKNKIDSDVNVANSYKKMVGNYYNTFYTNLNTLVTRKMHLAGTR